MQHTFVAYVEDKPGVLTRVASLFRRLNINISSVTVGGSERPNISRMTLVADAPPAAGHRIMASLYKLENVVQVDDVGPLLLGEPRTGVDQGGDHARRPVRTSSNW